MKTEIIRGKIIKNCLRILIFLILVVLTGSAWAEIIPSSRRIQWDSGVRGGIPNRTTVCANVKNTPYNAVGNGMADDTAAIQDAINACP